jgi:hypothetical protein
MKTVRSTSQEKREPGICMGDIYGCYIVCSYYFFLSPKLKKKHRGRSRPEEPKKQPQKAASNTLIMV